MKKCLTILIFLFAMCAFTLADCINIETSLSRYNVTSGFRKYQLADTILSSIYADGMMDEPIKVTTAMQIDSLEMLVYYWSAWCFFENEKWGKAIEYSNKALPYIEKLANDEFLSDTYHLQGLNYFRLGDFDNAAYSFKLTYDLDKKTGDVSRLSNTLNCIAGTYIANNRPELAERYVLEAIRLNSTIDEPERMSVYLGMASEMYYKMGDYNRSLQYAEQGLLIEKKLGRKGQIGKRLSQLASAKIGLGQLQEATDDIKEALPLLQESKMIHSVGICENQLGDIYFKQGNNNEAAQHYHRAADIFYEQGDMYNEARSQQGLYNSLKDSFPQRAMHQLERYNELKDSIYTKETQAAISRYNAEYNNVRLQEELEANKRKQNIYVIVYTIAIALAVVLFVILFFVRRRHINKQKVLQDEIVDLQQQNEQLHEWYKNAIQGSKAKEGELIESDRLFLENLVDIVNNELEKGAVDVETVASKLNITSSQLRARLSNILGETPRSYILNIKMQKARHLLTQRKDLTISQVALHCGYDESANFVHAFRKYYGVTPTEMRKN